MAKLSLIILALEHRYPSDMDFFFTILSKKNCVSSVSVCRFVQVVVQSRLGVRTSTRSKLLASSDWFNLSLPDRADVREATRAAFGDHPVSLVEPLCVEIALRTNENETMTLEYWYLQLTDKTTLPDSNFTVSARCIRFFVYL